MKVLILILIFGCFEIASAQMPTTTFWKKRAAGGGDPCAGTPAAGTACTGGSIYLGSYNGFKYMTTPGGCGTGVTPTCGGTDTLYLAWGASGTLTTATSTTDGASNTNTLASGYGDTLAAKYCQDMVLGGYSDWFLPATGEMSLMYTSAASIPGLITDGSNYWSSTDSTSTKATLIRFSNGADSTTAKTGQFYVRCVRKYT